MNRSRTYRRLLPFFPATPDLTGTTNTTGAFGFGEPPSYTCPPPPTVTHTGRATGWRPLLASLSYSTLGPAPTPHRIRISFVENIIAPDEYGGGTIIVNEVWRQVVFDDVASFVYISGLPIPINEDSGNPWGIQIQTGAQVEAGAPERAQPSTVIVDWEWARFWLDFDAMFFANWFRWGAKEQAG